jgi:hypothetical protein
MKVQLVVTPYCFSYLQSYGVTVCANVTSVYPLLSNSNISPRQAIVRTSVFVKFPVNWWTVPPASDTSLRPYKGRTVSCYQYVALFLTPGGNKQVDRIVTNLYDVWPVLCFTRIWRGTVVIFHSVQWLGCGRRNFSSWDRLQSIMIAMFTQLLQRVPGASGWGSTLTIHLLLVLRLGMHGAKPTVDHTP